MQDLLVNRKDIKYRNLVIMNVEVDGYNITYKITGSGDKTVVVLQGWGTNLEMYDLISDCLKEEYRVIQFDFPGFGGSDEPREPWNVDGFADFFCKLMQVLDVKSAILVGHSYGGRVIIKLAVRDYLPFKIEKIVLIDSAGIMPKRSVYKRLKIRKYKILKKLFGFRIIYALFPEVIDYWRSRQGSADYRNATPTMRQCMIMAVNEDLTTLLSKIQQDTLLIWGDRDTATPIGDAKIMEEKIPNSGLAVLEGTGHFSFLEKPQIFKNIMKTFLRVGV